MSYMAGVHEVLVTTDKVHVSKADKNVQVFQFKISKRCMCIARRHWTYMSALGQHIFLVIITIFYCCCYFFLLSFIILQKIIRN